MNARRMLRPLFVSALLAPFAAPVAQAAEVSAKDAARAASAWVDRGYAMGKIPAGRAVAGVDEAADPATGARLRVVRFEGGGYVVLSADDLVDPVLAFSETGDGPTLDEGNPFWALLRGDIAAREAAAGVERGDGSKRGAAKVAAEPTAAQLRWAALLGDGKPSLRSTSAAVPAPSDLRVDSFVASRWNQSTVKVGSENAYCYNYYTPNHYVCGCVATALGQLMRYFGKPTSPVAAATYTCRINGTATDRTMMGGTYDWAAMPAKPWVDGTTEEQRKAIGKLVYDVGVSVGMNWCTNSSGTQLYYGQAALREDFGYAQAVALLYQDYKDYYPWSLETFKQVVIPCLDARTPVGLSIRGDGGHAVLADGYGYSGGAFCLHVNFGWGSSTDTQTAWYCPPDLDTSSYSFSTINAILCNVFPDRTGNIFSGRVLDQSGVPVAGATVSFSNGQTTVSDANGIYAFVAPPGSYTATASKSGASASVSGELTETVPLKLDGRNGSAFYTRNKCGNSGGNDIVLAALEGIPAPVLSPGSGLFRPSVGVTISCSVPGATIRYTRDGTVPDESSPVYAGPLLVDDTATIRARAFAPGRNPSPVASATYTYDDSAGSPKGDDFSDPITIVGTSGSRVVADNSPYTIEDGEPLHTKQNGSYYPQYRSIWYRWTALGTGTMTLSVSCSRLEGNTLYRSSPYVAVYTGDSLSSIQRIGFATSHDSDYVTSLDIDVVRGTTYRIVGMIGNSDRYGAFTLRWSGDLRMPPSAVLSVR